MERVHGQTISAAPINDINRACQTTTLSSFGRRVTSISQTAMKNLSWLVLPTLFSVATATDGDDACRRARQSLNYLSCKEEPTCVEHVGPKINEALGGKTVQGFTADQLTQELCGRFKDLEDQFKEDTYNAFLADDDDTTVYGREPDGAEECNPISVEKHLNHKCETRELPLDGAGVLTPSTLMTGASVLLALYLMNSGKQR